MQNEWDVSLMIRNVWDDINVNWISTTDYGDFFGDPRYANLRSYQKPRTLSLTVRKRF